MGLFKQPASILPIQNLGEVSQVGGNTLGAFSYLDMSVKLYKQLDVNNTLKFKSLALLGTLLAGSGDKASCRKLHETIFTGLEKYPHCYELCFGMRNYGYTLAKDEDTRVEGQDYIAKSDEMQKTHPYWAERRMGLFVPVASAVQEDQLNI